MFFFLVPGEGQREREKKKTETTPKKENQRLPQQTLDILLPVHVAQHLQPLPVVDRQARHEPDPPLDRVDNGVGSHVEERPRRRPDFRGQAHSGFRVDDRGDFELRPRLFDQVVALVGREKVLEQKGPRRPRQQALLAAPGVEGRVWALPPEAGLADSSRGLGGGEGALGRGLAGGDGLRGVEVR